MTSVLTSEDSEVPVTVIESLCTQCHETGETRMMLTRVPFFRDLVVASFFCSKCGYRNNDLQLASEIQEKGQRLTLDVSEAHDLDRQVIKSQFASVLLPHLEFEIPPQTQSGVASTIEGILSKAAENLEEDQSRRFEVDRNLAQKIEDIILKLKALLDRNHFQSFQFVLDDPSGNSFIENPIAPVEDPNMKSVKYDRTREQLHAMGYWEDQSERPGADLPDVLKSDRPGWNLADPLEEDTGEVDGKISIPMECPQCGKEGEQNMCPIDVPGFRHIIVMAFVCEHCGIKSNEVKAGGAIGQFAKRWTLRVEHPDDLNRDVLKGDMAGIEFPELDLKLEHGTLGGVFTTVEGLLAKIAEELQDKFPFVGDSASPEKRARIQALVDRLKEHGAGLRLPFTLILDDPADHSHIGRRGAEILFLTKGRELSKQAENDLENEISKRPDPLLVIEEYPRSDQQNDMLGLKDMRVDNY